MPKKPVPFADLAMMFDVMADMELSSLERYAANWLDDKRRKAVIRRVYDHGERIYNRTDPMAAGDKLRQAMIKGNIEYCRMFVRHWVFAYVADRKLSRAKWYCWYNLWNTDPRVQAFALGKPLPQGVYAPGVAESVF
jgi:hypothetical protein